MCLLRDDSKVFISLHFSGRDLKQVWVYVDGMTCWYCSMFLTWHHDTRPEVPGLISSLLRRRHISNLSPLYPCITPPAITHLCTFYTQLEDWAWLKLVHNVHSLKHVHISVLCLQSTIRHAWGMVPGNDSLLHNRKRGLTWDTSPSSNLASTLATTFITYISSNVSTLTTLKNRSSS